MIDIRDFIEEKIKKTCPGDWRRASSNTLTWDWLVEDGRMAIIHGGPYTTDQDGNMVKMFEKPWEVCIMTGDGMEMHEEAQTPQDCAELLRLHLGIADKDCTECGGSGQVTLFSHVSGCNTCGGRP